MKFRRVFLFSLPWGPTAAFIKKEGFFAERRAFSMVGNFCQTPVHLTIALTFSALQATFHEKGCGESEHALLNERRPL